MLRHAVSSKVQGTVKVRKFKKVSNLNLTQLLICNPGGSQGAARGELPRGLPLCPGELDHVPRDLGPHGRGRPRGVRDAGPAGLANHQRRSDGGVRIQFENLIDK